MTGLVEDLLLLARLDAGRPLETELVDLTRPPARRRQRRLRRRPRPRLAPRPAQEPVEVVGDAARLHQVVVNLLANARTHAHPAGTTVTAGLATTTPGLVVLSVLDDGPGIPADLCPTSSTGSPAVTVRVEDGGEQRTGPGHRVRHRGVHRRDVDVTSRPGQTAFLSDCPSHPSGPPVPTPRRGHSRPTGSPERSSSAWSEALTMSMSYTADGAAEAAPPDRTVSRREAGPPRPRTEGLADGPPRGRARLGAPRPAGAPARGGGDLPGGARLLRWANSFYSAAVQAGSVSWKAFLFGSSDGGSSITVDKPRPPCG